MPPVLDFNDIARLLNFTRTTSIETKPIETGKSWALYDGEHKLPTRSYPFSVLYFNASAAIEDIKSALRATSKYGDRDVVYPASLQQRFSGTNSDISKLLQNTNGARGTRDYLVSFVRNEIQAYLKSIRDQAPQYYIDPLIEPSAGLGRVPNRILSFLLDPQQERACNLGIVLAEPGQGKTYMSKHIVAKLAETNYVPLMVDSSQWQALLPDSLSKAMANSFQHFGATIGWLDGHEDEFLNVMLKADVFRVVFDGLDEYILRNGITDAVQVLDDVAHLANTTEARIVITSRTSFWETNLSEDGRSAFVERAQPAIFYMKPFNADHAKNYFTQRFPHKAKVAERASQIYAALHQSDEGIIGRGFVLPLVADLGEREGTAEAAGIKRPLTWLLGALCDREQLRQDLPYSGDEQVDFLSNFAVEVAQGTEPNTDLLEYSMEIVREVDDATRRLTVEKLKSHPLLKKEADADAWRFGQEQVRYLLLARKVLRWERSDIEGFLARAKEMGPEALRDLGEMVVEMAMRNENRDESETQLRAIVKAAAPTPLRGFSTVPSGSDGSRLAGIIALAATERLAGRGSTHQERAELLKRLCGPETINAVTFTGTVARFDLRGVIFERCRFERVTWANCKFDKATTFRECWFAGPVTVAYSQDFGLAQMLKCQFDPDADASVNNLKIAAGERKYSASDLGSDVELFLKKFISKGGQGLKSVSEGNLLKGPISVSRYRDEIVDAVKAALLERNHISGSEPGYHVAPHAMDAFKFYAANNVLSGPLRDVLDRLKVKLGL